MNGIDQLINQQTPPADPIGNAIDEMFDQIGGAGAVCFGYPPVRLRFALGLRNAGIEPEAFELAMKNYDANIPATQLKRGN